MLSGGHSMGGWVTSMMAARAKGILGAVIISMGDMRGIGEAGLKDRAALAARMDDNREALTGVTGDSMAGELISNYAT